MLVFFCWLVQCLLVLLCIAFFTLFERKIMGLFHARLGPNKVSLSGGIQPLLDAFKLLIKQGIVPFYANPRLYWISPHIGLFLGLLMWLFIPMCYLTLSLNHSLLLFFCTGSFMVFSTLLGGWASNSKYRLIGCLRSIAQSISYEAVFSVLMAFLFYFIFSYRRFSLGGLSSLLFLILTLHWIVCTIAETHRAPFDFRESESELVSGFNTEYAGCNFAFIFLREYSVLLVSCSIIVSLFLGISNSTIWVLSVLAISLIFI